jgi:TonB-dependent starch-binding outer membrane protein SusC
MRSKFKWIFTLMVALTMQFSFAQEKTITGTVSDASGLLPGVNVVIKGTQRGVSTGYDGKYAIKAKEGEVLSFTFLGMSEVFRTVGAENVINITMRGNVNVIEEVVVIGYGTQKKKDVSTSIAKVKGADIANLVTPSFESQLAGRAAGLQITTPTGIVGEQSRIRIRGIASINSSNSPLIVVDGSPIFSGTTGGYATANALGDINPNDIESYEVLKDGAATAIYGSRGAAGVILITTKKGKKGATKVSLNSVAGFASSIKNFDLLQTPEFLVISNEKRTNRGQAAWAVGDQINTDWQGAVLKDNAYQSDHNLSFSGANEKTKYFSSIGYTTQEGVAKSNEMKRYSLRVNIEHEFASWISGGVNFGYTRTDYNGLNTGRNALSGNVFNAVRQLPNTPIYDSANQYGYNINLATGNVGQGTNLAPVGDNISNIIYTLDKNKQESKVNRIFATAFAAIKFTKSLDYRFQLSLDNANTNGFLFWDPIHGDGRGSNGRLQNNNTSLTRWNIQNILSFNKTFVNSHNIGFTGVVEYQKEKSSQFAGIGTNLTDAFFNQNLISSSYGTQESQGSVFGNGLSSYLARGTYNFKQKYYLQASYRRDGLSKLPTNNRWTQFIGYSAAYNVANEGFWEPIKKYVSEFKLRGSFAQTGNTEIGDYPWRNLYSPVQYGTSNGIAYTQFGNESLEWEKGEKIDFGADLGFWDDRVKLTLDYFSSVSKDLILSSPVSPSLGVPGNAYSRNVGDMKNSGFEAAIDLSLVKNKNFQWNVNLNGTFQKNIVTKLPNNDADIIGGTFSNDLNLGPNLIIRKDESVNSLYGYIYKGVNAANGLPLYLRASGETVQHNFADGRFYIYDSSNPGTFGAVSSLTVADKVVLGNTLPTYFGGFSSNMKYKNFDFNFLFRFSGGNKIFNATRRDLLNQNFNNNGTEILGRWQSVDNPGDGWTPKLWASDNNTVNLAGNATSRFVEDGDFISLENMSVGYSLDKMLIEKLKISSLRFFIQGQNLLLITKYKGLNPEMETAGIDLNGTPRARVISLGINLNL